MKYVSQINKHARYLLLLSVLALPMQVFGTLPTGVTSFTTTYTPVPWYDTGFGFAFQTTKDNVQITALGREFYTGNSGTHQLSLLEYGYNGSSWGGTVLAVADLTMVNGGADSDGFEYAPIAPVLLQANKAYVIVASEYVDDSSDKFGEETATFITMASDFTYDWSAQSTPEYSGKPTVSEFVDLSITDSGASQPSYGPYNFEYIVPEPSILTLTGFGLLAIGWMRRRLAKA